MYWASAPIAAHPATFAIVVPSIDEPPGMVAETSVITYRETDPKAPPAATTIRLSQVVIARRRFNHCLSFGTNLR